MNVIQSIDPAFVLVCCCVLLCTHLRDPVPHFRRHPFSDYGLASAHLRDPVPRFRRHPFSDYGLASVCVCVCVCFRLILSSLFVFGFSLIFHASSHVCSH